jgi:hypothetical protein
VRFRNLCTPLHRGEDNFRRRVNDLREMDASKEETMARDKVYLGSGCDV